ENAKELAIALERDRDTLETIMEHTNAHIAYLDAQFNFVLVNSTYEKGAGHTRDELLGRNHFELFPDAENEAIFKKVRDTGEPVEFKAKPFEFVDQPWRGATYWDWTLTPIKDASGHVIALVLSLVDVTDSIRARQLSDALNTINAEVNSTLDFSEIMTRVVVDSAKNMGSEGGVVLLREGDRWVVSYTYGFPPEVTGTRLTDDEARHAAVAASTGKPVAVDDTATDVRVNRKVMEKYGIRSILAVPLIVRNDVIGALCFCYRSISVTFTEAQIDFANKLATSVSLSLENARLYAAERNIADTLQEALLIMPERVDGVAFGNLYRSATEAARVGGDFYDIFELEHDKVGIIIGDVSGKGLEAAALTSIVKNTIKAHAYEGGTPALIMAKANDLVAKTSPADIFVTVFFGILDTKTGKLTYCSAGHPPALIKRSTGYVDILGTQSPVIGAFAMINYNSGKAVLHDGDDLILYTDGIIEARCNRKFFGEKRLVEVVKALKPASPQEIPGALFDEVMHCTGGKLSDDIALLCVSLDRGVNA
ncbi:MAG: SpoIIE family protein phosphatase, partial [Candidatus Aquicultor sp.]